MTCRVQFFTDDKLVLLYLATLAGGVSSSAVHGFLQITSEITEFKLQRIPYKILYLKNVYAD